MLPVASLAPFVFLATRVVEGPTVICDSSISLAVFRRIDVTGALDLVQKDRRRSMNLVKRSK